MNDARIVYLNGSAVYEGCTCEITDAVPGDCHMGLVPYRRGKKAMGIACNGRIHAYLYLTETDMITGAEIVPGAYGRHDMAVLGILTGYVGCVLRYARKKPATDGVGACCCG